MGLNLTIGMAVAVSEAAEYLLNECGDPYRLGTDLKAVEQEIIRFLDEQNINVFTGQPRRRKVEDETM